MKNQVELCRFLADLVRLEPLQFGRLGVPQLEKPDQANVLVSLPSNPEAVRLYSLGLTKMREYDYAAARGLFAQTTKADPKFPLAYSMLSRCDLWLGHDDQAKAEAKRGLNLASGLSRVQRMEVEASYYHAIADRGKAAEIYKVLFDLFPDSLDYGLHLAKLQLESDHPNEALETIRQLRRLPPPARDDPGLDLREADIAQPKDGEAGNRLYRSAAEKALTQGKKLAYATAEKYLCYSNPPSLPSAPECERAYEAFLAAGNRTEAGSCLQFMAERQRYGGHDQEAIPFYEQALRIFKEAGNRRMVGVTLNNLSLVLENEGQWDRAEQNFREAQKNFQAVNSKPNAVATMCNMADISFKRGRLSEAAQLYRQSWEISDESGRLRHEYPHTQYAALLLMKGELAQARAEIETQVNSLRTPGSDPWQLASSLGVLGDLERASGNLEGARKNYEEARKVLENFNVAATNGAQISLAELSIEEGHADAAEATIRIAVAEFEKGRSAGEEIGAYTSLSRALLAEGKPTEAQDAIKKAFNLVDLHRFPVLALPVRILDVRAKVTAAKADSRGRTEIAAGKGKLRAVIGQAHQLGLYQIECEARLALGELEMKINSAKSRAQLTTLSSEARSHGLELIARKATVLAGGTNGTLVAAAPSLPH